MTMLLKHIEMQVQKRKQKYFLLYQQPKKPKPIRLKGRGVYQDFDGLDENVYYDEDKILKLVDKDKFLKYMVKSKYRNKPKSKDLKDMFDTYISGDKDMEKNIGKYDEKNERNVK